MRSRRKKYALFAAPAVAVVALAGTIAAPASVATASDTAATKAVMQVLPRVSQPGLTTASWADAHATGTVEFSPATPGGTVVVQRRARGTSEPWAAHATGRQNAEGRYTFPARDLDDRRRRLEYRALNGGRTVISNVASGAKWAAIAGDQFMGSHSIEWNYEHPNYTGTCTTDGKDGNYDQWSRTKSIPAVAREANGVYVVDAVYDTAKNAEVNCANGAKFYLTGIVSLNTVKTPGLGGATIPDGSVLAARIKLPRSSGNYAAFWLKPKGKDGPDGIYPNNYEIDIVESFGPHSSHKTPQRKGHSCDRGTDGNATAWSHVLVNMYRSWDLKTDANSTVDCVSKQELMTKLGVDDDDWFERYHVWTLHWPKKGSGQPYRVYVDGHEISRFPSTTVGTGPATIQLSNHIFTGRRADDHLNDLPNDGATLRCPLAYPRHESSTSIGRDCPGSTQMRVDWIRIWQDTTTLPHK